MTPELHDALVDAGAQGVTWYAAHLRATADEPIRLELAAELASWSPETPRPPAGTGPDPRLIAACVQLAGLSAAECAVHPVAYRLRVAGAQEATTAAGKLMAAVWAEVDAALLANITAGGVV